jgi:hypothetical protein
MILAILILNACLTWFMTGLIWFVQIVHYPLFDAVSKETFTQFANRHCQLTGNVVMLPMLGELLSAFVLILLWQGSGRLVVWAGFAIVVAIWVATLLLSIPCHQKFCTAGFSETTYVSLVAGNWLRTVLWSIRSVLVAWLIYKIKIDSSIVHG